MGFDAFWVGFATGIGVQDAIFILAGFVLGPILTIKLLERHPEWVVRVLRVLRKDADFRREMGAIMVDALDYEGDRA